MHTASPLPPLAPDIAAMLHVPRPRFDVVRAVKSLNDGTATKADAQTYIAGCREAERVRRAALPEWQRHLEDLMGLIPEDLRSEAGLSLVPLCNALSRAAVLDANKLAREVIALMSRETERAELESFRSPADAARNGGEGIPEQPDLAAVVEEQQREQLPPTG